MKFTKAYSILFQFLVVSVFSMQAQALQFDQNKRLVTLDAFSDYEKCQGKDYTGELCVDAMTRWLKIHPENAFEAGKVTRKTMNHWNAIPFFSMAFAAGKGQCADEDVKLAVISALNLPTGQHKEIQTEAHKIAFENCFKELQEALVQAATTESYLFTNFCKDLLNKNALSGLKKKKCETLK